jgi:hypothetical protein
MDVMALFDNPGERDRVRPGCDPLESANGAS